MKTKTPFPEVLFTYVSQHEQEVLAGWVKIELDFQKQVNSSQRLERFMSPLSQADTFFTKTKKDYNKSIPSVEQTARFLFLENHCQNRIVLDNNYKITSASFNWSPKVFTRQEILTHIGQIRQRELVHV